MKKIFLLLVSVALLSSCNNATKEQTTDKQINDSTTVATTPAADVSGKSFDELFKSIDAKEIDQNIFKLLEVNYSVITAGKDSLYNSMTASWGGWGRLYEKQVAWCTLNASRYTLELIKKNGTYTFSFFDETYKDQVLFLGSKTGRDSDKMKELKLTKVDTPSGNITYKEAFLVIECKVLQQTTINPADVIEPEDKEFLNKAYKSAKNYHQLLVGDITKVWVKK
ncbi:flavin reductase (DIM6/NTAB) family NADH-FMN oxidoreductase RutF [Dysgonomonas alginatilytica]|uniref:Type IV secretion system putative lipoprotein virB7 n=1 Tax=Dysgonomonas alginatilytica TaxID=1605892 RepID=A0A2V3PRQ8_9BACT|nr:flavin reductase [Dysgonomonas alginatilytica]PXV65065.1 flavin reductase (DIM6/NTAB) family NADH-FMN oxidoreductase RutF [Dysgonomonas alginatilytica]